MGVPTRSSVPRSSQSRVGQRPLLECELPYPWGPATDPSHSRGPSGEWPVTEVAAPAQSSPGDRSAVEEVAVPVPVVSVTSTDRLPLPTRGLPRARCDGVRRNRRHRSVARRDIGHHRRPVRVEGRRPRWGVPCGPGRDDIGRSRVAGVTRAVSEVGETTVTPTEVGAPEVDPIIWQRSRHRWWRRSPFTR